VVVSSNRLRPQEKGEILLTIRVKGRKGPLLKSVQIFSNDPEKSIVTLKIKALIE
jgi:hypothetical protein